MGTLSKRPLREFGVDLKERIEDFRSNVGTRIDRLHDKVDTESRHEGSVTKSLERMTASLPSSTWLALAGVSMLGAGRFSGRLLRSTPGTVSWSMQ